VIKPITGYGLDESNSVELAPPIFATLRAYSITATCIKYMNLTEAYKSLSEALLHAGIHTKTKVNIHYFDSEEIVLPSSSCHSVIKPITGYGLDESNSVELAPPIFATLRAYYFIFVMLFQQAYDKFENDTFKQALKTLTLDNLPLSVCCRPFPPKSYQLNARKFLTLHLLFCQSSCC
jgi:hypothetical protein